MPITVKRKSRRKPHAKKPAISSPATPAPTPIDPAIEKRLADLERKVKELEEAAKKSSLPDPLEPFKKLPRPWPWEKDPNDNLPEPEPQPWHPDTHPKPWYQAPPPYRPRPWYPELPPDYERPYRITCETDRVPGHPPPPVGPNVALATASPGASVTKTQ